MEILLILAGILMTGLIQIVGLDKIISQRKKVKMHR